MKKQVIALKTHSGTVHIDGSKEKTPITLPKGCTGILFCFESIRAARLYWGHKIKLVEYGYGEDL